MTNLKRLSVIFPSVLLAATGLLAACGNKSDAKEPEGAMEKAGQQAEKAGTETQKATQEAADKAGQTEKK